MSLEVRSILSPICWPLLRMERWERQAALGAEVVPLVNWMLTMSVFERGESGVTEEVSVSWLRVWKGVRARNEVSTRPEELSRRITCLREGASSDST